MPTSIVGLGAGARSTHFQVPSALSSYSMCSCCTVMEPRVLGVTEGREEGRGKGTSGTVDASFGALGAPLEALEAPLGALQAAPVVPEASCTWTAPGQITAGYGLRP